MKEDEYIQLYEDSGWKCFHKFGGWYYFSRKYKTREEPDLSIFNNDKSRLQKYRRIIIYLLMSGFPVYYFAFFVLPVVDKTSFYFPNPYFFFRIFISAFAILIAVAIIILIVKILQAEGILTNRIVGLMFIRIENYER